MAQSGVVEGPLAGVVVVGAGIGGLGAALAFSRAGMRVTLIERDDTPLPESVEAAFDWDRRGAPQVRHSHGFAARMHRVLGSRFPDVLDDLREAGAVEHDLGAMLTDDVRGDIDDLKVIAARRTTYEWVLRRARYARRSSTCGSVWPSSRCLPTPAATTGRPVSSGWDSMTEARFWPTRWWRARACAAISPDGSSPTAWSSPRWWPGPGSRTSPASIGCARAGRCREASSRPPVAAPA